MRKITESTFVSLDGVTEDPRAWAMGYFNENAQQAALDVSQRRDADGTRHVRVLHRGPANRQPVRRRDQRDPQIRVLLHPAEGGLEQLHDHPRRPRGRRDELKQQDGRDLIMYGHGRLSQTLLEHHLLDEIRFAVHPLLLTGRAAGRGNGQTPPLKLIAATPLPSGVVALSYQPDQS